MPLSNSKFVDIAALAGINRYIECGTAALDREWEQSSTDAQQKLQNSNYKRFTRNTSYTTSVVYSPVSVAAKISPPHLATNRKVKVKVL